MLFLIYPVFRLGVYTQKTQFQKKVEKVDVTYLIIFPKIYLKNHWCNFHFSEHQNFADHFKQIVCGIKSSTSLLI